MLLKQVSEDIRGRALLVYPSDLNDEEWTALAPLVSLVCWLGGRVVEIVARLQISDQSRVNGPPPEALLG